MTRLLKETDVRALIEHKIDVLVAQIAVRRNYGGRPASDAEVEAMRAQVSVLRVVHGQLRFVATAGEDEADETDAGCSYTGEFA